MGEMEQGHAIQNPIRLSGLSHKSMAIDLREKFSVSKERCVESLQNVLNIPCVEEAVVLSTCNRVEVVTTLEDCRDSEALQQNLETFFEQLSGLPRGQFAEHLYHLRGDEAVTHLFRVASGLDSMVLGEPQILGQVKTAYEVAQEQGATRTLLNRAFHRAFGVAKTVRTETNIGRNAVSVCYAAKELAVQIFGELKDVRVMLIGAGEMGRLSVKHFRSAGVRQFFLVNKTLEKAVELAEEVDGVALSLANLPDFLPQADIVLGAVTLGQGAAPILTRESLKTALRSRHAEPQFLIDLGVPRNFSDDIADLPDAFLYNLDDLQGVVEKNFDARQLELERAQVLVTEEAQKFTHWLQARALDPEIKELFDRYGEFQESEVEKTMRRLRHSNLTQDQLSEVESAVRDLSRALISKSLHQPVETLKRLGAWDRTVVEVFRNLFLKKH